MRLQSAVRLILQRLTDMKLDDVKKLHQKKYRSQFGCYLVEGEHLVLELQKAAQQQRYLQQATLYVTQEYMQQNDTLLGDFTTVTITTKQMAALSDTKTPQGIVACVPHPPAPSPERQLQDNKMRNVYLYEVQDPGNLGTILRTLAWFGNYRLLLSPNSVDPFNAKVVRASMGAIFHTPIELEVSLPSLASRFAEFAYLDMQGSPIQAADFGQHACYLFGNEARGVPHQALQDLQAKAFTIAGSGNIDSLNLASAVTICAYQLANTAIN